MFGVRIFKFVFNVVFDFLLPTSHFSLDTKLPHLKKLKPLSDKSSESLSNNRSPVERDPIKVGSVGQFKNIAYFVIFL